MDQSEELKGGETLPETENQSKAKSKQSDDEVEPESWETRSKQGFINFKSNLPSSRKRAQPSLSSCSSGQLSEKDQPPSPKRLDQISDVGQPPQEHQMQLGSIFMELEKKIVLFVKDELKEIQKVLCSDYPECSEGLEEDERVSGNKDEKQSRSSREAFLKITVDFLRMMNLDDLADLLQSKSFITYQQTLKSNLKKKLQFVFEGIAKSGNQTFLNQIYTELYITEGDSGDVNKEHEVRQIETVTWKPDRPETTIRHEDIFKPSPDRDEPIRAVMTKGVAGIGKTVLVQKFTLDWAEDQANQDIQFTFPFTFRELNLLKDQQFSLVELVHHFFSETRGISRFEELKVVFIFDGLDESRLPLNFHNNEILTDVTKSTSVDVLLTNLIRGNLLPKSHLWITTRPAAASRIPTEFVGKMTEIRGFTDPQKDEYFIKRFKYKKEARMVISHIKKSRSLHIMCHIPIFCWITATVVEDMLNKKDEELPTTLTEMYIHFLVVQNKLKVIKYDGGAETDSHWSPENHKMIESLGKLAFDQLMKGNLIFYESDLAECGIDIRAASVCSGVFTQIFREERSLYQSKVFCFVHLSVQEFLAALHVHLTFIKSGINLLAKEEMKSKDFETRSHESPETDIYKSAADMALESPDGHLDLFLRFLLGLSLNTNRRHLGGLVKQTEESLAINKDPAQYIKEKLNHHGVEKSINLFHCLNELKDQSLVEEIQQSLNTGSLSAHQLSPAQWSALHFILLSSDKSLEIFDLKKYSASENALLRLLPMVKIISKVILSGCNLSERSCEALSSLLSSTSSSLRDLDLSNNDLRDSGVTLLCNGLMSPNCELKILRLSGCLITDEGCAALASALTKNPSHLKELDLSFNYPREAGMESLAAILKNPSFRLESLNMEPGGERWLTPGLRKYSCPLTVDLNTANRFLKLSDKNRKVTHVGEEQLYPDHSDRFDLYQLLCIDGLTGRSYWEVEWGGKVYVSLSYRGINRKGVNDDSWFGLNDNSWSLGCSDDGYTVWHNGKKAFIPVSSHSSSPSGRVAVYVDCSAGTLSFYRVSSDTLIHIYTANTKFTEQLYPGFGFEYRTGSWMSLCSL
ncbi:NACHT, LRR and PYD domains-containing protein 7-like [Xiphophorus hellerii]|uniref:NACHT, LRR and PYD domains-containing protein 7-like n=1 Tax=Xiphophorus hellerii TaxID=8084 RepID=UPI0013B3C662|nr:NACHT, LRR and PYD domains-containing protein 7-like [Xiphophorus hellerii]XP_032440172.1 NACHT, LRR and PYD domains-containing protein 7-like [Xiphophorus hellerii]